MDRATAPLLGEMSIMDSSGHKQLTWDTDSPGEVAMAREAFDDLIAKGYSAFASEKKMEAKHLIGEFNPAMKDLIMVPRNVGG